LDLEQLEDRLILTEAEILWIRQFGAVSGAVYGYAEAVASDGNVYVGGHTHGTLPGQSSAGADYSFISKYDTNGTEHRPNLGAAKAPGLSWRPPGTARTGRSPPSTR
jgi:hypothetical protein